jgi:hypothetical protein
MSPNDIRPIDVTDFKASLVNIRPSVSASGLKEFEDWAKEFGERGGWLVASGSQWLEQLVHGFFSLGRLALFLG